MGKYCCFFDPKHDYEEKELNATCPECGRTYDFMLRNLPNEIKRDDGRVYRVIKAVGRGFYGATYLCEVQKRFEKEQVLLKIIPKKVYEFFGKDFEQECNKHAEICKNTEHLVKIIDAFDTNISFEGETIDFHIAELQYVNGEELSVYLNNEKISPNAYAQIAIDLLEIWNELILKNEYHNDLHMGNLMVEILDDSIQRVDAIYDKIRLVAIDLNSSGNKSLSNYETDRYGDRKHIANHIAFLSRKLREKYKSLDDIADSDYRLIETLNNISSMLSVESSLVDFPEISELIRLIKDDFHNNISYSPWNTTFHITKFNDGINAQTIQSYHVPQLLVDPDNSWINSISVLGPQLITGMRGCGKTMLLHAIDIHARLNKNDKKDEYLIQNDRFVGISASCRELINIDNIDDQGIIKLILLYSKQILTAIRHMQDINMIEHNNAHHIKLYDALQKIFEVNFDESDKYSIASFERTVSDMSNNLKYHQVELELRMPHIVAFESLSQVLLGTSNIFSGKQVFFLLDDASTRYLSVDKISKLLTKVLFMSEICAFKITTEMQTIYSFKTVGNIDMAQDIRDYQIFDLGADVFNKTRHPAKGKEFIQNIIEKRLKHCYGMQDIPVNIIDVLGDCKLNEIAKYIIEHTSSSERKKAYYGATALASLCVGDIGDIIYLYESILSNNTSNKFPIERAKQTHSFQQLCSRRMYNIERKDGTLKAYVMAFAEASYKCLMDSYKAITKEGKKSERIRQYNGLYVRMTTGDIAKQQEKVRQLVDAGIFVFADGNGWPRSKSTDTDPMTQVKLAYRKLFGLSNFIGLANADRYELSGEALEQWLENPSKEILLRNLGGYSEDIEKNYLDDLYNNSKESSTENQLLMELVDVVGDAQQLSLFKDDEICKKDTILSQYSDKKSILSRASLICHKKLPLGKQYDIGIFGLGFEERTFESIIRIVSKNTFSNILLIEYNEIGYKEQIEEFLKEYKNINVVYVQHENIERIIECIHNTDSILLDITGLYKPIVFNAIRSALSENKKLDMIYTSAIEYYPLNKDIEKAIKGGNDLDNASKFIEVMNQLTTGENSDYTHIPLLNSSIYDCDRPTALLGFVSPKNQRIFSVLDKKDYDAINLITPNGKSDRDVLSRAAGDIAASNYAAVTLKSLNAQDPKLIFSELVDFYERYYIQAGYNIELALTGSKMQAVVAAIFSSVCKVSQCWYIKPDKFDTQHFTTGVGESKWYTLKIKEG